MPLWFEIAVLTLLTCLTVGVIDLCFCFEAINKNLAKAAEDVVAAIRCL